MHPAECSKHTGREGADYSEGTDSGGHGLGDVHGVLKSGEHGEEMEGGALQNVEIPAVTLQPGFQCNDTWWSLSLTMKLPA